MNSDNLRMDLEGFTQYDDFEEKFKPKKTTDDCYTPAPVYEAVLRWTVRRYGLEGREVLRPFYPGGDFERADYPAGCVVIDNPPFSILAKIDGNKERGIFGSAFLVGKNAAAAQAAAQAQVFALSPRELALVEELTKRETPAGR